MSSPITLKSFFVLSIMCLMFSNILFADQGHDHGGPNTSMHDHHWKSPRKAAARTNPVPYSFESIQRGKVLFGQHCISCHGEEAKGDGPEAKDLEPKPADLTIMAGEHTAGDLAWKIANGRGPMPAWQDELNENQIWDVVNFIKSLVQRTK